MRKRQEKYIQLLIAVLTVAMVVLRFLLNEKGRVNPDSIRFLRFAKVLPEVDNTTTPLGYPAAVKFFSWFGMHEFWASKAVGIAALLAILIFAWKKKFYLRETVITMALFSFVSIFSYTMTEALILPAVFLFLYVARNTILNLFPRKFAIIYLTLSLILLFNIRYSSIFFMAACFLFGIWNFRKKSAAPFIISSFIAGFFVIGYKFFFIDYYNPEYVQTFLEIGVYPTSKLLPELFQGLFTSFNPFIHIADPAGGLINYGIYGVGILNVILMIFVFVRSGLSETERFFVLNGIVGIVCSFFIQYVYAINPMDYRLLAPFIFSVWLVYFRKLFLVFGVKTYGIAILSLITGFAFTWMTKANYLQNREEMKNFLTSENLINKPVLFYVKDQESFEIQTAELASTVNPLLEVTFNAKDTLKINCLTERRVLDKMKVQTNEFQK